MESRYASLLPMMGAGLISAVCVAALALGFKATADQDPSTDNIPMFLPYNGVLEHDGQGVNAADQWLRFELEDVGEDSRQVVYTEDLQVDIYDGRFTAVLGSSSSERSTELRTVFQAADNIYVRITILGDHDPNDPASTAEDDVVLSDPKRVGMSANAVWASHATDFSVAGTLTANEVHSSTTASVSSVDARDQGLLRIQPGGGQVRVGRDNPSDGGNNALFSIPEMSGNSFIRAGRFMIDSDHDGTANLLAGVYPSEGRNYLHYAFDDLNNRGSSRVQMTNGELRFQPGAVEGSGPVMWNPGMTVSGGGVAIDNGLNLLRVNGQPLLRISSSQAPYASVFSGSARVDRLGGVDFTATDASVGQVIISGDAVFSDQSNMTVTGPTRFNEGLAVYGSTTFNSEVSHSGVGSGWLMLRDATGIWLNAYRRSCSAGVQQCNCFGADDLATAGGVHAGDRSTNRTWSVIGESRLRYDEPADRWGWFSSCQDIRTGVTIVCPETHVICISTKPRETLDFSRGFNNSPRGF